MYKMDATLTSFVIFPPLVTISSHAYFRCKFLKFNLNIETACTNVRSVITAVTNCIPHLLKETIRQ